jgi:predicted ATPase
VGGERLFQPGATHGFVAALTSFVGRDDDVAQVAGLLAGHRLVTVTGPGGMGKTRLASEVARLVAGRFADGAWLVELAAVPDSAQVAAAVAARLGVPAAAGLPVTEALAAVLARQQLLLVLDNCEHVLDAVAELCASVLPVADDVRVLATSREPIGLAGETRFRLRPLATEPPDDRAAPAAVRLFADRARQADPRFVLDRESGPVAARLVQRLDGMPLAIELAAARVEALGLSQLADRLAGGLQLLTSSDRTAPARHRSLAATVEWSYRLLDSEDQRVFRRLAVFPGPFTLEAAVAVAGPDTEPAVLHLVDCSLLSPPRTGPDGRARYLMPATVGAFGAARLSQDAERASADVALAGYALSVAEQAAVPRRSLPRPAGSTPRMRRSSGRRPGPWNMIRTRRCGWPWPWPSGGRYAAATRRPGSCYSPRPAVPRRAACRGAWPSSGSATSDRPPPRSATRPPPARCSAPSPRHRC